MNIGAMACCIDNNKIWLSEFDYNALYSFNINDKQLVLEHQFINLEMDKKQAHESIYKFQNKLFLTPLMDCKLIMYDIEKKVESAFPLLYVNSITYLRMYSMRYGSKIYLIPQDINNKVEVFDMEKQTLEYEERLNPIFIQLRKEGIRQIKFSSFEDKIIITGMEKNMICMYDFGTGEYEFKKIKLNAKISNSWYDGKDYWISFNNTLNICRLKFDGNQIDYYDVMENEWEINLKSDPYSNMIVYKHYRIFLNYYSKNIICINEENSKKSVLPTNTLEKDNERNTWGPKYSKCLFSDNLIYFIPCRCDLLIVYDTKVRSSNTIQLIPTANDEGKIRQSIKNYYCSRDVIIYENNLFKISDFIKNMDGENIQGKNDISYIGKRIFKETID